MPSPRQGQLIRGDRLRRRGDPAVYVVTRRFGKGFATYSVSLKREDGLKINFSGVPAEEWTLRHAHYEVFDLKNGEWSLIKDGDADLQSKIVRLELALHEVITAAIQALEMDPRYAAEARRTLITRLRKTRDMLI